MISLIGKVKSEAAATSTSPANADAANVKISKTQAATRRAQLAFISAFPGVTEPRIFKELRVRKTIEKRDEIVLFGIRQFEATHIERFVRIVMADARIRSRSDRSSPGRVMIDHFRQSRNAAVVHIRCRHS